LHDTRRTRLVLGVLIIAALGLIAASYQPGSTSFVGGIGRAGASVLGGVENLASSTGHLLGGSGSGSSQIAALQKQNALLRAQLSREQLSRADYSQLTRLLALAGKGGYRIVAASVIATGQGFQQRITLDAGSADGVAPRETVLNGQGLIGEVTAVTAHNCTVLLATDASSQVGIEMAPGGELGWVTGPGKTPSGSGLLQLQVLNASAPLRRGEQVVTSASVNDRPYVPGVPVGVIASVQNRRGSLTALALVRPYVDFTALGIVGIVVAPPAHDPRFSVLPPAPQAKPTPTVTVTVTPGVTPAGPGLPPARPSATPSAGG
jgi:rod shape-determining protein MreC